MRADSSAALAKGVVDAVGENPSVEVALCPPAVFLSQVAQSVAGTPVGLGAQNLYPADDGAFTGEVNASMLTDVGCRYVILGHSERAIFENRKMWVFELQSMKYGYCLVGIILAKLITKLNVLLR